MWDLPWNLAFLLSAAGYVLLLNRRYRIAVEFAPALYCSICVCVLVAAGILNFLLEATVVFSAAGVICFGIYAKQIPKLSRREWGILAIFGGVLLYLLALLGKTYLTNYDVYSHWGVVVRQMLLNNRVPNVSDKVVNFKSYPLGSSLWIYYFCRVNCFGDGMFAFAQQVMQVSFLLPVLAWVKKENRYMAFLPAVYFLYGMVCNVSVNNLQVDSLLPIMAVGVFAAAAYYRNEPRKGILCGAPMLVLLLQVKSSAIYFAAVYWVWAAWCWRRDLRHNKKFACEFMSWNVAAPLAGMLIWMRHVSLVFGDEITNKHAVSLKNYSYTFSEKTAADISLVVKRAIQSTFQVENGTFWLMILLTAGLLVLLGICRFSGKSGRKILELIGANWAIFVTYLIGLCGMYLFSMPQGEADRLASFARYFQTCGVFLLGLNVLCLLDWGEEISTGRRGTVAAVCLAVVLFSFWNPADGAYRFPEATRELLKRGSDQPAPLEIMRASLENYGYLEENARYGIYQGTNDNDYTYFLLRYETGEELVSLLEGPESLQGGLELLAQDYDYLLIWEPDEISDRMLTEYGLADRCGIQGVIVNLMTYQ